MGGLPKRSQLYSKVTPHVDDAIKKLVALMNCGTPAVEMAAAKVILAKAIPDLKAMELTGEGGTSIIKIVPAEIIEKYNIDNSQTVSH